jgi:hypothetical protein
MGCVRQIAHETHHVHRIAHETHRVHRIVHETDRTRKVAYENCRVRRTAYKNYRERRVAYYRKANQSLADSVMSSYMKAPLNPAISCKKPGSSWLLTPLGRNTALIFPSYLESAVAC